MPQKTLVHTHTDADFSSVFSLFLEIFIGLSPLLGECERAFTQHAKANKISINGAPWDKELSLDLKIGPEEMVDEFSLNTQGIWYLIRFPITYSYIIWTKIWLSK